MVCLLGQLFGMRRLSLGSEERVLLLTYLRKGIGRIQGISKVLHYQGKVFCKVLNNSLVQCLGKKGVLHEGRARYK